MDATAPIPPKHSFFQHGRGTTHYQRVGADARPVVVLVSGATLPMGIWEPLVGPLVAVGFQILRYDLPGRGYTPLDGLGADFQAHLEQLEQLLSGLGLVGPVHMLGVASGALVVAEFAARNPSRVSHVCLIAPDGAATRFTLTERVLSLPLIGRLLFRSSAQRTLLARVPRYSSRTHVQAFIRDQLLFSLSSPGFHEGVLATVRTFPLHQGEEVYRRLARTGIPTCVVWGAQDPITPPRAADLMRTLFGKDAVQVLEGVGHLPFAEEPGAVAALVAKRFRAGSNAGRPLR
jgi:pimeloyl-ACP methyl ester carboxylesterase